MTELAREEASVVSRRTFLASAVAATGCGAARSLFSYRDYFSAADDTKRFTIKKKIAVVEAPLNLGLRPPHPGHEPGVRLLAQKLADVPTPAGPTPRELECDACRKERRCRGSL